jgi:sugar diacid utilization regulator
VSSLAALLASPVLSSLLGYVVPVRDDPTVSDVAIIEDLGDLGRVTGGTLVILTHGASHQAGGYRLDVALRMAGRRGAAALVLSADDAGGVTSTAAGIADRRGIGILVRPATTDLAQLAMAVGRELAGDAGGALVRAHGTLRALEAHPADTGLEALLTSAGAAGGIALRITAEEPQHGHVPAAPVRANGQLAGWISVAPSDRPLEGDAALGAELSVFLTAASAGWILARAAREQELPIRSRDELLSELLLTEPAAHSQLVQRARAIGLPIDGWHVVVHLEIDELAERVSADTLSAYATRQAFGRAMLTGARLDGGTWHTARSAAALLLVRTFTQDPGITAPGHIATMIDGVLGRVRPRMAALVRCGVGSAHPGSRGVLSSAAEARAAATAARASGRANAAVAFDSIGLRRALVEWYASDVAQEAVTTVLQPLRDLGGARAERLIQTLHVYLDQQGSVSRTGQILHLHRNAVTYRVKQIFELLDVDPGNADDLLLLQLACRARALT